MDVMSLTPEERAALKAALDEADQPDPLEQVVEIVEYLCDEIKAVKEAHEALKSMVMEDLIGGIKEAYEGNERAGRMEAFKGKYGSMLDPLAAPFEKTFGANLHDKAFDYMDSLRGEDGYTDEMGDSKMKEVIEQIKEKLGLNEPAPAVAVTEVGASPAEAPAAEGEADEEPDQDAQQAWNEIEAMKRRDDSREAAREKSRARKGA